MFFQENGFLIELSQTVLHARFLGHLGMSFVGRNSVEIFCSRSTFSEIPECWTFCFAFWSKTDTPERSGINFLPTAMWFPPRNHQFHVQDLMIFHKTTCKQMSFFDLTAIFPRSHPPSTPRGVRHGGPSQPL